MPQSGPVLPAGTPEHQPGGSVGDDTACSGRWDFASRLRWCASNTAFDTATHSHTRLVRSPAPSREAWGSPEPLSNSPEPKSHAWHASDFRPRKDKPPTFFRGSGVWCRSLTMTYSHMGRPHTTIGDASFHC